MLQFLLTISDESNHNKIEMIYTKYHDDFMRYALSKLMSYGRVNYLFDAEDAVQNTFLKIVKYIDNIDFSRSEVDIRNYCITILINEITNISKDECVNLNDLTDFCLETEFDFVNKIDFKEKYNRLVEIIKNLDEKYSSTLYLAFWIGKKPDEIAEMMGISLQTVYSRLHRGKELLIDLLEETKSDE